MELWGQFPHIDAQYWGGRMRRKKTPTFEQIQKRKQKCDEELEAINKLLDRNFLELNAEVFERHLSRIQKLQGYREMVN